MTSVALNKPMRFPIVPELFARQRTFATYGLILLPLTLLALLATFLDPRTIDDVNIWAKPAKFLFSGAVLSITAAWFFDYVRPERRQRPFCAGQFSCPSRQDLSN